MAGLLMKGIRISGVVLVKPTCLFFLCWRKASGQTSRRKPFLRSFCFDSPFLNFWDTKLQREEKGEATLLLGQHLSTKVFFQQGSFSHCWVSSPWHLFSSQNLPSHFRWKTTLKWTFSCFFSSGDNLCFVVVSHFDTTLFFHSWPFNPKCFWCPYTYLMLHKGNFNIDFCTHWWYRPTKTNIPRYEQSV